MSSLVELLVSHGYSPQAAEFFAVQTVASPGSNEDQVEARFNALIANYYMQYLAIKLEGYGFNLNRFDLPADELHRADSLIEGRLGTPKLDCLPVVQLLESMVVSLRRAYMQKPMCWQELFEHSFHTPQGQKFRASEMVRALIRSNTLHNGARATHYKHRYNGITYSTLSMHEVMAAVLKEGKPKHLSNVNRYGIEVKPLALEQLKAMGRAMPHLSTPKFKNFYDMNAHHNINQYIRRVFHAVNQNDADLGTLLSMQEAIKRENYNPVMYPDDWRRFLDEVDIWLEAIATPYAQRQSAMH